MCVFFSHLIRRLVVMQIAQYNIIKFNFRWAIYFLLGNLNCILFLTPIIIFRRIPFTLIVLFSSELLINLINGLIE